MVQLTSKSGTRCAITSLYNVKRTAFISKENLNTKETRRVEQNAERHTSFPDH